MKKKHFVFNPLPHNDTFWPLRETSLLKTLCQMEKLLVTSNFSFTHNIFYTFRNFSAIFIKFEIVCKLSKICRQQIG